MFSDNKSLVGKIETVDTEVLKNYYRFHKCRKCKRVYPYDIDKPDNTYVDYDDDWHYDCPYCGTVWYRPVGLNFLGCIIRNIFF